MKALGQKIADLEKELLTIRDRPIYSNPIPSATVQLTSSINSSVSQTA